MSRSFFVPALVVCAAGLFASSIASAQTKIGVVNFQKAILDTAELKKASTDLQNKYKPRQDALEKAQRELADIQTQLQGSGGKLSAQGEADLQARGQRKQREVERLGQDLQDDVNNERNTVLQRAGARMQEIVKKMMDDKGLDLIIDIANAVSFKPSLDVTSDAVAAYDKAYPLK
jgi:outer membrane protein